MQTKRNLEFKNFECNGQFISADMYLDSEFVVKFTDSIEKILRGGKTNIALYELYKIAVKEYLSYEDDYKNKLYLAQQSVSIQ